MGGGGGDWKHKPQTLLQIVQCILKSINTSNNYNILGQPIPFIHYPLRKEVTTNIDSTLNLLEFKTMTSCNFAICKPEKVSEG